MSHPKLEKVRTVTAVELGLPIELSEVDNTLSGVELGLPTELSHADSNIVQESIQAVTGGKNVIYFGPPGVGKSFAVKAATRNFNTIRIVFHPEYSYGDFIGTYRPVVGFDPNSEPILDPFGNEIQRPVNYFEFVPGPMIRAILMAYGHPEQRTGLIIEEINRGDCAAIFGDFFQLLDRNATGRSEYGLAVSSALGTYLRQRGINILENGQDLYLPPNLWLYATMNTSDQALFPMDSAFKRRWEWKAVPLMSGEEELGDVVLKLSADRQIKWTVFIKEMNNLIVQTTNNEDKQIGPWYVETEGQDMADTDIRDKLLFYLWHDVFRNNRRQFFAEDINTFDELQERFDRQGGIGGVLKDEFRHKLTTQAEAINHLTPASSSESAMNTGAEASQVDEQTTTAEADESE